MCCGSGSVISSDSLEPAPTRQPAANTKPVGAAGGTTAAIAVGQLEMRDLIHRFAAVVPPASPTGLALSSKDVISPKLPDMRRSNNLRSKSSQPRSRHENAPMKEALSSEWKTDQTRSKRSRLVTLVHAATKSLTNFSWASALP